MDSNPWILNFKLIEISWLSEPFSNGFRLIIPWIDSQDTQVINLAEEDFYPGCPKPTDRFPKI